jgi:drug/metabolite transporter (DMT)-like permease
MLKAYLDRNKPLSEILNLRQAFIEIKSMKVITRLISACMLVSGLALRDSVNHHPNHLMALLFLILACALWGVSFPLMKVLNLEQVARMPEASSVFLSSWLQCGRFLCGSIFLLPFVLRRKAISLNEFYQGLQLAFWGGLGMWLQADALAYTDASTSAFLTQAYCVILPLWACLRLRKMPAVRVVLATCLVVVGCVILSGIRWGSMTMGRGEIETIIAAVFFAFQILALEKPKFRGNRGLPVTLVMFAGIALLFIPITLIVAPSFQACLEAGASYHSMTMVVTLALLCSVGAYLLMNIWQPKVSATEAGLIYTTEPVFTAAYVLFIPALLGAFVGVDYRNESFTLALGVGGGLILLANVLMQWKRPPHLPPAGPIDVN